MIELILLTGFLGAGKTTFAKQLLQYFREEKTGLIVNEFGEINVDAQLLHKDGVEITELSNGSIFCSCIKENFIHALVEMSARKISLLVIEASGLADPSDMAALVQTLNGRLDTQYNYAGSVCIVDSCTYSDLQEQLPAINRQIYYSGAVILNKVDRVDENQREALTAAIEKINPKAAIFCARFCEVDMEELLRRLTPPEREAQPSSNVPAGRPYTVCLKIGDISKDELKAFLTFIAPSTYRIKGFFKCGENAYSVSGVGSHLMIMPWPENAVSSELVVISAIGIAEIGVIAYGIDHFAKGKITI